MKNVMSWLSGAAAAAALGVATPATATAGSESPIQDCLENMEHAEVVGDSVMAEIDNIRCAADHKSIYIEHLDDQWVIKVNRKGTKAEFFSSAQKMDAEQKNSLLGGAKWAVRSVRTQSR